MTDSYASVTEVPAPEGLSKIQEIEFNAFKKALSRIEAEWRHFEEGTNEDYNTCLKLIDTISEKKALQAEEVLKLRKEVIQKQYEKEMHKILISTDEYKASLKDRMLKAFLQAQQSILSQLRDQMGPEYDRFISSLESDLNIQIPTITTRSRAAAIEENEVRLTSKEIERDINQIQAIIQGFKGPE